MRVFVLGAGPAGLGLAHGLSQAAGGGPRTVLIDSQNGLGGLARTISWGAYGRHDLGPHKLFTADPDRQARLLRLLPKDQWLFRPKVSSIYIGGHFLPYPPSPLSLGAAFGIPAFLAMTADYLWTILRSSLVRGKGPSATFEEDLRARVGGRLYEALFKPTALKFWGDPRSLDAKLSQGRVQTPSVGELALKTLGLRRSSRFEALEFLYPQGGLDAIWEAIRRELGSGAEIRLRHSVTRLRTRGRRVESIAVREHASGRESALEVGPEDFVFSTLPLQLLSRLLQPTPSARVREQIERCIRLNDLLLVFLKAKPRKLLQESWVFVPDPDIVFHRLSEQASFDPGMTPDGSILCCESMSHAGRPLQELSDAELVEKTLQGLERMGHARGLFEDAKVIRLPKTYPVYPAGSAGLLQPILEHFDGYENLRTIGRHGSFNYIGSLDAMDIGYGSAAWLLKEAAGPRRDEAWRAERLRTQSYPVLD